MQNYNIPESLQRKASYQQLALKEGVVSLGGVTWSAPTANLLPVIFFFIPTFLHFDPVILHIYLFIY